MSPALAGLRDDLDALLWSALYVAVVIGGAELLRRRGLGRDYSRKIVHVGIGSWVGPTYLLYEHRLWAALPPLLFVVVNALSYRYGLLRSIEGEERNIGTLLYPVSVALAIAGFWGPELAPIGLSAILVLAWGDAAASLVGRRWGTHRYRVGLQHRSYEGSLAMLVVSFAAVVAAYALLADVAPSVLVGAALAAIAATVIEARSVWGLDNLFVPAAVALTLWWLGGGLS